RVLALARDLVDLVYVDDTALALGHVELTGLEETDENVLDVFAHVARLGERGGVGDGEGYVEDARERLSEQCFTDAGGADEEDVGLVELHIVVASRRAVDALVVVVDRNGESLLRAFLSD